MTRRHAHPSPTDGRSTKCLAAFVDGVVVVYDLVRRQIVWESNPGHRVRCVPRAAMSAHFGLCRAHCAPWRSAGDHIRPAVQPGGPQHAGHGLLRPVHSRVGHAVHEVPHLPRSASRPLPPASPSSVPCPLNRDVSDARAPTRRGSIRVVEVWSTASTGRRRRPPALSLSPTRATLAYTTWSRGDRWWTRTYFQRCANCLGIAWFCLPFPACLILLAAFAALVSCGVEPTRPLQDRCIVSQRHCSRRLAHRCALLLLLLQS